MLRNLLISLASEHIYFSCFHQLLVFMHTWDGIRSWSLWTPVSSGLGGWILGWGGEGTRKLVGDFLAPKVTLKCDPQARGFVGSGWKNTCLVSRSLCLDLSYSQARVTAQPWLQPSATWTGAVHGRVDAGPCSQHAFLTPTSPPCLHWLHCTRLYLTSPRTFSPFLLWSFSAFGLINCLNYLAGLKGKLCFYIYIKQKTWALKINHHIWWYCLSPICLLSSVIKGYVQSSPRSAVYTCR